jgi:GNAT superfamily N-acetyltransferase
MSGRSLIEPAPWDRPALGVDSFEVTAATPEAMTQVRQAPGHYSIKVDPLASKKLLHESGFYYCDTLVEPHCTPKDFVAHRSPEASVTRDVALAPVLAICHGAFAHGRFHRDFNVERARADARYDRWLAELHGKGQVYALHYGGALAGFVAVVGGKLVLHALAQSHRGRGLARYLWTALCETLFAGGAQEVSSSISFANLAALNLYAALGFRFRNPKDVYHCVIP